MEKNDLKGERRDLTEQREKNERPGKTRVLWKGVENGMPVKGMKHNFFAWMLCLIRRI